MEQRQRTDCWAKVARSLNDFDQSMGFLLNDHALVDRYPDKWVGVWQCEVRAAEDDLDILLKVLDKNDVPRSETAIRFIEPDPVTLIL